MGLEATIYLACLVDLVSIKQAEVIVIQPESIVG